MADDRFVGFDFAGIAADLFGASDPATLGMQYAASATISEMSAARRLTICRDMLAFFRELESKAAAELGHPEKG